MAFKMKGNPYKMGGVKTKQTMAYMKSPLEHKRETDGKYIVRDGKRMKQTHSHIDKEGKKMTEEEVTKANLRKKETDQDKQAVERKKGTKKVATRTTKKVATRTTTKSPLEQTSFVDKLKSAGKAAIAGLYAESTGPHDNLPATISRAYKKEKKKYREEDRKKKMEGK